MRAVIAHFLPLPSLIHKQPLLDRNDDLLCLGNPPTHLPFDPQQNSYAQIAAHFPSGWQPQAYLHWSLEYNPVPQGLEEAECFTVGIVGDWNLGGQAFQQMGGAFDLLLADRTGCDRLRAAGFARVAEARLWAYEAGVHRRLEGVERDLDIVMAGSFNHEVQRERARWLGRLAKLSRKYRVHLTQGVYGEEYVQLLNRAKIVFNRSIGGGVNMRAYEAPACGAVMFYERENPEIRDILTDRQECVLYEEDDLEDLLDYYLSHEEERAQIGEAGYRKIQAHSYEQHLSEALTTVEAAMGEAGPRSRAFLSLSPDERLYRHAYQRLLLDPHNLGPAETQLMAAEQAAPPSAETANARACVLGRFAECLSAENPERQTALQQAARTLRHALELRPDYAVAWFNLAQLQFALSNMVIAAEALRKTISLLENTHIRADQLHGPYYAAQFQALAVAIEEVWSSYRTDSDSWIAAMRSVMLWRAWEQLSDVAFESGRFVEALDCTTRAISLRAGISGAYYRRARALRLLGRLAEAEREYRRALEVTPLYPQVWAEMMQMCLDSQQRNKGCVLLEEVEAYLNACPCYEPFRPMLQAYSTQFAQNAAPTSRTLRLLALPDWNDPAQWQPLLREYVLIYGSEEAVSLLLPVEPERHPPVEAIITQIECLLRAELQTTLESIPDITLWPCPQAAENQNRRLPQADALVCVRGQADTDLSVAARLPLLSLEHLPRARRLVA
jgi:tetratricopeptide (TPR) repeat protein